MIPQEIERRFLLKEGNDWRRQVNKVEFIEQGYIYNDKGAPCVIRVRLVDDGKGFLTIKSKVLNNPSNFTVNEFEYEIPSIHARQMLKDLCGGKTIKKNRYELRPSRPHWDTWVVDEFFDENYGLLIAEIELNSELEALVVPDFLSEEITGISKYANAALINNPFTTWEK